MKKESANNPYYKGKDFEEQPNTTSTFDAKKPKDKRSGYVWNLYPFARLCLNERDNCFYGIPLASEHLETQKSINNHFSVYDKALEDNVLGGFIYRKGAVDPSEITTENGQMIGIESNMNEPITNAFGRFPAGNVPADSANYSQNLIGVAKSVAGISNVQLGMSDFAGQSGKQTQLLLDRAKENATDNAMLFNEYKIDQAEIMFLFAKFFYDNEDFVITEHGVKQDNAREYKGDESFNGSDYMDDYVTIDIRVGAAPSFSEYNNVEITGLMVQSGQLPFEAYVNMMPEGYISNRQEVVDILKNNSNLKIASLEKMIEQQNQVMQQMSEAYKQTQKDMQNITTVISENERLKSMLAEVSANNIKNMQEISAQNARMTGEMQKLLSIVGKK